MNRIEELREHYDSHDLSAEMEQGHWETDVVEDPMITTSLRLPKSLLDWVREQAGAEHVKPTAWIRALIENTRAGGADLEDRVRALESTLAAIIVQAKPAVAVRPPAASRTSASQKLSSMKERTRTAAARNMGTGRLNPATRVVAAVLPKKTGSRKTVAAPEAVVKRKRDAGKR